MSDKGPKTSGKQRQRLHRNCLCTNDLPSSGSFVLLQTCPLRFIEPFAN